MKGPNRLEPQSLTEKTRTVAAGAARSIQAALVAAAFAFNPAARADEVIGKALSKAADAIKVENSSRVETAQEVILPPGEPAEPVKSRLTPQELQRLLAAAEAVHRNPRLRDEKSVGIFTIHRIRLVGEIKDDGSLKLAEIDLQRDYPTANLRYYFTLLPDGRIGEMDWVRMTPAGTDSVKPLARPAMRKMLREELEFWLSGTGWRKLGAGGSTESQHGANTGQTRFRHNST